MSSIKAGRARLDLQTVATVWFDGFLFGGSSFEKIGESIHGTRTSRELSQAGLHNACSEGSLALGSDGGDLAFG